MIEELERLKKRFSHLVFGDVVIDACIEIVKKYTNKEKVFIDCDEMGVDE